MHFRKLVKSGNSSHVIAIPRAWLKKNKLNTGDVLTVSEENDNSLRITKDTVKKKVERTEKIIQIEDKTMHTVKRDIMAAYLHNYFYIKIKGKKLSKYVKELKSYIGHLVAAEVVDESHDLLLVRNFLNIEDTTVSGLVRRIDNIVRSMIIDTKELIGKKGAGNEKETAENIFNRDQEVNRLTFLVFKILKAYILDPQLRKRAKLETLDLMKYWEVMIHLEKIGDRIKLIAKRIPELSKKQKNNSKLQVLFKDFEKFYFDSLTVFHKQDMDKGNTISARRKALQKRTTEYMTGENDPIVAIIGAKLNGAITHTQDVLRILEYLS